MTTVVHPGDSLTPRQRLVYVLVLGALTALGSFTIDLYLPAFPVIEGELDVSTALIQLTLTATPVGFAVGLFGIDNAIPMASIMGCAAVLSSIVLWAVVRPWTVPALSR